MGTRSERPTPRREREARRRGDLPRSSLFTGSAGLLGAVLGLLALSPHAAAALKAWTTDMLLGVPLWMSGRALASASGLAVRLSAPALAAAWLASALASSCLGGIRFDLSLLGPRLDRLRPSHRLARMFTLEALVDGARPLLLAALLAAVGVALLRPAAPDLLRGVAQPGAMVPALGRHARRLLLALALVTFAAGCVDALWAHLRRRRRLRMTREEVVEEQRLSEGDPRQRARRRALHRSLLLAGRARGVRTASALVVNPTHLAVALRHAPSEADAPYLVAKGSGLRAQGLRREALRLGIPVVRDVALARSLTAYDVGEEIPEELYQAAAAVLEVAASGGAAASGGTG